MKLLLATIFIAFLSSLSVWASTEASKGGLAPLVIQPGFGANFSIPNSQLVEAPYSWNATFLVECPESPEPLISPFGCDTESSFFDQEEGNFFCAFDSYIAEYDGCTASLALSISGVEMVTRASILSAPIVSSQQIATLPDFEESSILLSIPMSSGIPPKCRRALYNVTLEGSPWHSQHRPEFAICFPRLDCRTPRILVCEVHVDLRQFYPLKQAVRIRARVTRDRLLSSEPNEANPSIVATFVPTRPAVAPDTRFRFSSRSPPVVNLRFQGPNLPLIPDAYSLEFSSSINKRTCPQAVIPLAATAYTAREKTGPVGGIQLNVSLDGFLSEVHGCSADLRISGTGIIWRDFVRFVRSPLIEDTTTSPLIEGALVMSSRSVDAQPFRSTMTLHGMYLNSVPADSGASTLLHVMPSGPWNWCRPSNGLIIRASNVSITGTWIRFHVPIGTSYDGCRLLGSLSVRGEPAEPSVFNLGTLDTELEDPSSSKFLISIKCERCTNEFADHPTPAMQRQVAGWVAGIFLLGPINATDINVAYIQKSKVDDSVIWVFRIDLLTNAAADACTARLVAPSTQRSLKDVISPVYIDSIRFRVDYATFACVTQDFYAKHRRIQDPSAGANHFLSVVVLAVISVGTVVVFAVFAFVVLFCRLRERQQLGMVIPGDMVEEEELAPIPSMEYSGAIDGVSQEEIKRHTNDECSICLESKNDARANPCGHWFCEKCIVRIRTCALCRADIEKVSILRDIGREGGASDANDAQSSDSESDENIDDPNARLLPI